MILNDVITEVRRIIQDETTPYRYSDTILLSFANQALKRIAVLRPDLFAYIGTVTCEANKVLQEHINEIENAGLSAWACSMMSNGVNLENEFT